MGYSAVGNYVGIVWKLAWRAWRKLPPQTRVWISPEDVFHDGLIFARYVVRPKFNKVRDAVIDPSLCGKKDAKLNTYIYKSLVNFYKGYLFAYFTAKRFDGRNVCLEEPAVTIPVVDWHEQACEVMLAFEKLLTSASPSLRAYLTRWFLPSVGHKFQKQGLGFDLAREEFLELAKTYRIGIEECRIFLLTHPIRRQRLFSRTQ